MTKPKPPSFTEKLVSFRNYQGEDEVITYAEIQDELSQKPQKIILSYFPSLDHVDVLHGFEPGEVIVISGVTKSGKTLLGQTLSYNFWNQGIHSLWFSFELTYRQFGYAYNKSELPVILMPKKLKAYALDWLEDRIAEAIAKYGIEIVFIDHLHFLFDLALARNPSIEIGQVMRYLKRIAVEANIVIFLMCHFKKHDMNKEPDHSAFRDSSLISAESDVGLVMWRKRKTENEAVLKVCYSRRTGVLEKKINILKDFETGLLVEREDESA